MGQCSCATSACQIAVPKPGIPDARDISPLPRYRPWQFRIPQHPCARQRCRRKGCRQWRGAWLCWGHRQDAITQVYGHLLRL